MTGKFKFKEYCPLVFRNLRERFGVNENSFNQALSATEPYFEVYNKPTILIKLKIITIIALTVTITYYEINGIKLINDN